MRNMLQFQGIKVLLELSHMNEVCRELGIVATTLPRTFLMINWESPFTKSYRTPRDRAAIKPKIKASYFAILLVASNSRCTMYFT